MRLTARPFSAAVTACILSLNDLSQPGVRNFLNRHAQGHFFRIEQNNEKLQIETRHFASFNPSDLTGHRESVHDVVALAKGSFFGSDFTAVFKVFRLRLCGGLSHRFDSWFLAAAFFAAGYWQQPLRLVSAAGFFAAGLL